ncbi:glycosyltransferase family 9 protein [bacterium]|nr:glycosyltransferase family 9 protein [bacterium]
MNPVPLKEAQNIAVIRTDHIGDLIVSTPFLNALRKAAPQAKITAILPKYTEQVLYNTNLVNEILTYDGKPDSQFLAKVKDIKADIAISLAPRTVAYKLAHATGAPCRVGYYYANRPLTAIMCRILYLTHTMSLNLFKELRLGHPILHEVQQLGELAKAMQMKYTDESLHLVLDEKERSEAQKIVHEWNPPLAALQLHNNWLSSNWSFDNMLELINLIKAHAQGGHLMIFYGPAEKELAQNLQNRLADDPSLHFLGGLTFRQWASLLDSADFVVTPDTGAVHLASSLHKTVIAIYEERTATLNTQQWAPWQVPHRSIVKGEPEQTLKQIDLALNDLLVDKLAWEAIKLKEEENIT